MHVGYGCYFPNPDGRLADAEAYQQELRLAEMAEPLGFDSIWSVEHHFDDYTMCPDVLRLLIYFAGRTRERARDRLHGRRRADAPVSTRNPAAPRTLVPRRHRPPGS